MAAVASESRALYAETEIASSGFMPTIDGKYQIYYEVSGNPAGKTAVFLHGGPGNGTTSSQRRYFDPAAFKIVTFDQRGAPRSKPAGSVEANTTQLLVADIEQLRELLEIDSWDLLVGGSWGSTLALAYATEHADKVKAMVLFAIYLPSHLVDGTAFFPGEFEKFLGHLTPEEMASPLEAYFNRMSSADESICMPARQRFMEWKNLLLSLNPDVDAVTKPEDLVTTGVIEMHYTLNNVFLDEAELLANCNKIDHIPCDILHGRYDMMTAPAGAWKLHQALPKSNITFVPDSGHEPDLAPRLEKAIIDSIDRFK